MTRDTHPTLEELQEYQDQRASTGSAGDGYLEQHLHDCQWCKEQLRQIRVFDEEMATALSALRGERGDWPLRVKSVVDRTSPTTATAQPAPLPRWAPALAFAAAILCGWALVSQWKLPDKVQPLNSPIVVALQGSVSRIDAAFAGKDDKKSGSSKASRDKRKLDASRKRSERVSVGTALPIAGSLESGAGAVMEALSGNTRWRLGPDSSLSWTADALRLHDGHLWIRDYDGVRVRLEHPEAELRVTGECMASQQWGWIACRRGSVTLKMGRPMMQRLER